MQLARLGQQWGQRREHRPIDPGQSGSAHPVVQHGDLVTQHENHQFGTNSATGRTYCRQASWGGWPNGPLPSESSLSGDELIVSCRLIKKLEEGELQSRYRQ
jgi:hypothetical protein